MSCQKDLSSGSQPHISYPIISNVGDWHYLPFTPERIEQRPASYPFPSSDTANDWNYSVNNPRQERVDRPPTPYPFASGNNMRDLSCHSSIRDLRSDQVDPRGGRRTTTPGFTDCLRPSPQIFRRRRRRGRRGRRRGLDLQRAQNTVSSWPQAPLFNSSVEPTPNSTIGLEERNNIRVHFAHSGAQNQTPIDDLEERIRRVDIDDTTKQCVGQRLRSWASKGW